MNLSVRATMLFFVSLIMTDKSAAAFPPELSLGRRDGACPDSDSVAAHLRGLVGQTKVSVVDSASASTDVDIIDLGSSYRIRVLAQERDVEDPERHCDERARVAAVAVALILEPPIPIELPRPSKSEDSNPDEASAIQKRPVLETRSIGPTIESFALRPRTSPAKLRFDIMVHATRSLGPLDVLGMGANLRFAFTPRDFGFALGIGGVSTERIALGAGSVALTRFPSDLSLEWAKRGVAGELVPSLGLTVDALHFDGSGYATPLQAFRVSPGARAALSLRRFVRPHWGIGIEVSCSYFPMQYTIATTQPDAELGTPRWWFGLALGASWRGNWFNPNWRD